MSIRKLSPALEKALNTLPPEQGPWVEALALCGLESEAADAYSERSPFAEFHDGISLAERHDLDACLIRGFWDAGAGEVYTAEEVLANVRKTLAERVGAQ